jgi:hypothetical protein
MLVEKTYLDTSEEQPQLTSHACHPSPLLPPLSLIPTPTYTRRRKLEDSLPENKLWLEGRNPNQVCCF